MLDTNNSRPRLFRRFAHLDVPPEAIDCAPWHWHGGNDWRRHFVVREWNVGGLWVSVAGEQNHRGEVRRWLHVGGEDQCTTSDRHRLIAALVEAGQLLDAFGRERMGVSERGFAAAGGPAELRSGDQPNVCTNVGAG